MRSFYLLTRATIVFALSFCALSAIALSSTRSVTRNVPKNIREVRRVYVQKIDADRVFARRLQDEMRGLGFRFVTSRTQADAIFVAQGEYSKGAFYGAMKFTDANGRILWSARVMRPRGSSYMAYSRLTDKLRDALHG